LGKCRKSYLKRNVGHESFYGKLDVFNKGKIYVITGKEKGKPMIFRKWRGESRSGIKDYIKIFHPELLPIISLLI
jgi:iron complex transport system substrate-binding protein